MSMDIRIDIQNEYQKLADKGSTIRIPDTPRHRFAVLCIKSPHGHDICLENSDKALGTKSLITF